MMVGLNAMLMASCLAVAWPLVAKSFVIHKGSGLVALQGGWGRVLF